VWHLGQDVVLVPRGRANPQCGSGDLGSIKCRRPGSRPPFPSWSSARAPAVSAGDAPPSSSSIQGAGGLRACHRNYWGPPHRSSRPLPPSPSPPSVHSPRLPQGLAWSKLCTQTPRGSFQCQGRRPRQPSGPKTVGTLGPGTGRGGDKQQRGSEGKKPREVNFTTATSGSW
jgi:hypothetical protein